MTYRVMAETLAGTVLKLRGGFKTLAIAEGHPVTMKHWRRVWVEKDPVEPIDRGPPALPPRPWQFESSGTSSHNGQFHRYIVDANGRRIMAIWGTAGEKDLITEFILTAANKKAGPEGPG